MNSLKFIDTEIKCCYLNINKAKEENLYQKTLSILIPENKNINLAVLNDLQISLNEEKIKFFQQIKTELEAWYSVKSGLIYEKESKYRMSEENRCSYIIYLTDDEVESIQKALEVNNNE